MRSSEVQNFNLFAIRNKKLKFFAFGNGLRSNAFRTTQSAHSAMHWILEVDNEDIFETCLFLLSLCFE